MLELLIGSIFLSGSLAAFFLFRSRRTPFAIWSPVYIFPGAYAVLGFGGYVYYRFTSGHFGGFYDLSVTNEQLAHGLAAFLVAIGAFFIGALAFFSSKRARRVHVWKRYTMALAASTAQRNASVYRRATLKTIAFLLFPLFLTVAGIGPNALISRTDYLVERYHYALVLGSLLSLPAIFYLGMITLANKGLAWRTTCVAVFLLYQLIFFSMSTRRIVVMVVFYIFGLSLGGARRLTIIILTTMWLISLPLVLQIPLELRGMPKQGIDPMFHNLSSIADNINFIKRYAETVDTGARNLTFGLPLAGYVGSAPRIPLEALAVSINPLPSFMLLPSLSSWESLRDSLRVTQYIPYSALGELSNHGWLWLIFYYFLVGLVAAWLDTGTRHFEGQLSRLGYIGGCGLLLLFSVTSTQYNLRSSSRLVWYAIAIAAGWRFICRIRLRKKLIINPAQNPERGA